MAEHEADTGPDRTVGQRVAPERLHSFTSEVFRRLGMGESDAQLMAEYFVWAELHGLPFVGIRRLPEHIARLRAGVSRLGTSSTLSVVEDRSAFAVVDAEHTFAQIAGVRSMQLAVEKARSSGTAIVIVRNTTSAGALGYLAARAAEQGMIGLAINNTGPVVARPGGTRGVVGAQPFAVACPGQQKPALLLDMTNTVMSMVRIHEVEQRGESLPAGVALAADGTPTTDPAAAIKGILLPAGHRAYGLAVMWEVITGILAGGPIFGNGVGLPGQLDREMGVSLFLLAIDPAAAMEFSAFTGRVETFVDDLRGSAAPTDSAPVRLPGERSQALAQACQEHGIPIPDDVVASITAVGLELGVLPPLP